LVDVLGFDIGGANTKAAFLHVEGNRATCLRVVSKYFPVWKDPQKLGSVLLALKTRLGAASLDVVGVTMTAELSDAYQTKREGVNQILSCVQTAFPKVPMLVLNTDGEMISSQDAKNNPIAVASANWVATGWTVAKHIKNAVVVDVGSTSTSIIPIVNGQVVAKGKTDLDKLICGELVYTGSLRTNIAAIVHSISIRNGVASVSSELFATSGDVHLLLGHLAVEDFTSETADGRGKTVQEAMARLARGVCADTDMLTKREIVDLADYVYQQQIKQIANALTRVYTYTQSLTNNSVPVVVTGLGKDFLAKKAAESICVDQLIDLDSLLPKEAVLATPAVGVAFMAAAKQCGETILWK
jgi:(4-(4-[2-(gamma-L-glutamylamino)ethyl]phenoxymethyl)furan-2-yl)methanamine synthase